MVSTTVKHDSYVISLDTSPSVDEGTQSQPKLTTYLFNMANGQPTATSIQTHQPISDITSTPSPFTSLDTGVVPGVTVPTAATSTTHSSLERSTPESHLTAAVLGVSVGLTSILSLIAIYCLYRIVKNRRRDRSVSKRPQPPTTPSNWSTSPLSSPNSLEKGGKSPLGTRIRSTTPRKPAESFREKTSCHVGLDDDRTQTEQSDGSRMASAEDYHFNADERNSRGRFHDTTSVRGERLFQLKAPNHRPRPQAHRRERSQTVPAYDNSSLPPLPQQGPVEVRELTSILKRPINNRADAATGAAHGNGKGWLGCVQARFGEEKETYKPTFADEKTPVGRKGVTFAGYQIREFGMTPMASRTASTASGSTDAQ